MTLVFSTCSVLYQETDFLTSYGNVFPPSFGRQLFSMVRATAFGNEALLSVYAMRGGLTPSENRLASAIDKVIKERENSGKA